MKLVPWLLAAAAGASALVLAVVQLSAAGPHVRTPREVVGAFVYHLERGNFGKACGLMADEARATVDNCSSGFVYNTAVQMLLGGADPFAGATLLPGSRTKDDGSIVYRIKTEMLPAVDVTVAKRPTGRYRITRIG